jgi:hypothetical protein
MASSLFPELRAIWLVWSRQQLARYRFWLQLAGFDTRDLSWSSPFYLIYVLIFMAGWAFAMLALMANGTAGLLLALTPASPERGALAMLAVALVGWTLYELFRSSRRSPFVFTPEDGLLLCQTPVSRRAVALAWFAARWLVTALPFAVGVLVLESGVVGLQVGARLDAGDLVRYMHDGLRGLSLVIPWQTAMLALAWAAGAHRLQRDRDRPAWRWVAPFAVLLLGLGLVWSRQNATVSRWAQTVLWPFILPLRAALGQAPWGLAMVVVVLLAAVGVSALLLAAGSLNLSRAAQETSRVAARQQARLFGLSGRANELAREDRLGSGRAAARWPSRPGMWAVLRKDVLQARRDFTLGSVPSWLLVLSLSLGAALTPEWGTRVALAAFWILAVGGQTTARLRSDLARWWMWQQLPLSSSRLLFAEMARSVAAAIALTWLGLGAGGALAGRAPVAAMLFVPTAVASIACAAVYAVLRPCRDDTLLVEQVPQSTEVGLLLGLLCTAVPFGIVAGVARQQWPVWPGVAVALLVSLACANGVWRLAVRAHQRIA